MRPKIDQVVPKGFKKFVVGNLPGASLDPTRAPSVIQSITRFDFGLFWYPTDRLRDDGEGHGLSLSPTLFGFVVRLDRV